jgi:methyltransferase (TIGR00027 family)
MSPNIDPQQTKGSGLAASSTKAGVSMAKAPRGSLTSKETLRWRAIESLRPEEERVCYDNMASSFMDRPWDRITRNRFMRKLLIRQSNKDFIGMGGFIVARTRYVDEYLKAQVAEGIKQLVILGAGYDSRAYRLGLSETGVKVFEVDHPDTQVLKMMKVQALFGSMPKHVAYVHVDFAREKLEVNLPKNGYDSGLKTLFIWEGVMMYLTAEAVDQTLAFISGHSGQGSCIVFDYLFESAIDGTSGLKEAELMKMHCAKLGEPLRFALKDNAIGQFLSSREFSLLENTDATSLKDAYFKGKGQQRKVFPLAAIACARVEHR